MIPPLRPQTVTASCPSASPESTWLPAERRPEARSPLRQPTLPVCFPLLNADLLLEAQGEESPHSLACSTLDS